MGPVTAVSYLMQHIAVIAMRQTDQTLQERLGIGMSQFKLLMILQHCPNVQQRKVAECLGQTEASVSRQIKLLCDKGLLTTRVNPKSRREHVTMLTAKGMKMTDAAAEVINQYSNPLMDLLTDKQRQVIEEALHKFHDYVCAPGKPFACDHPFDDKK